VRKSGAPGTLTLDTIVDLWSKIRADVKAINRRIEAILQQVDPAAVNGSQILLVSPYEFHRNRINSDEVRLVVEDVIGRLVGSKVQVHCVPHGDVPRAATAPSNATHSAQEVDHGPGETPSALPDATQSAPSPNVESSRDPDNGSRLVDVADAEGVSEQARKDDLARITAAKNIFDAEEIN
jgi:DNA polymerase-3 subunit gamma/tau